MRADELAGKIINAVATSSLIAAVLDRSGTSLLHRFFWKHSLFAEAIAGRVSIDEVTASRALITMGPPVVPAGFFEAL